MAYTEKKNSTLAKFYGYNDEPHLRFNRADDLLINFNAIIEFVCVFFFCFAVPVK
jgi:hypothetical protein